LEGAKAAAEVRRVARTVNCILMLFERNCEKMKVKT